MENFIAVSNMYIRTSEIKFLFSKSTYYRHVSTKYLNVQADTLYEVSLIIQELTRF